MSNLLLTGASGFLGKVLERELKPNFNIQSLGRSSSSDIDCDLGTAVPQLNGVFDYLIHNAGHAHRIPRTKAEEQLFWAVNRDGTRHLLEAFTTMPPRAMVLISTVAVYGVESGGNIAEEAILQGRTPYAASKIAAETIWQTWADRHGVPSLILRLPLVAGPNPPGNLGAIAAAIKKGYYLRIGANPARKSIVRADDVAQLIASWLKQEQKPSGIFNLTDDRDPTFSEIETALAAGLQTRIRGKLPQSLVTVLAGVGDGLSRLRLPAPITTDKLQKMTASLTFDCTRAKELLRWRPRPALDLLADPKNWERPQ